MFANNPAALGEQTFGCLSSVLFDDLTSSWQFRIKPRETHLRPGKPSLLMYPVHVPCHDLDLRDIPIAIEEEEDNFDNVVYRGKMLDILDGIICFPKGNGLRLYNLDKEEKWLWTKDMSPIRQLMFESKEQVILRSISSVMRWNLAVNKYDEQKFDFQLTDLIHGFDSELLLLDDHNGIYSGLQADILSRPANPEFTSIWHSGKFGLHPRHLVASSLESICSIDFRMERKDTELYTSEDWIFEIEKHPSNSNYYCAVTEMHALVLDLRYPTRHLLRSPHLLESDSFGCTFFSGAFDGVFIHPRENLACKLFPVNSGRYVTGCDIPMRFEPPVGKPGVMDSFKSGLRRSVKDDVPEFSIDTVIIKPYEGDIELAWLYDNEMVIHRPFELSSEPPSLSHIKETFNLCKDGAQFTVQEDSPCRVLELKDNQLFKHITKPIPKDEEPDIVAIPWEKINQLDEAIHDDMKLAVTSDNKERDIEMPEMELSELMSEIAASWNESEVVQQVVPEQEAAPEPEIVLPTVITAAAPHVQDEKEPPKKKPKKRKGFR